MVGLGQEGLREGGGNCVKHLKRGWKRKEGRGNKGFKKGAQAGSRSGCLKKGGGWNPLTNYGQQDIVFINLNYILKSPLNFFYLDVKITIFVSKTKGNFLHLLI